MQSEKPLPQMPDNFPSILTDFLNDLTTTFPEYANLWDMNYVSTDNSMFEAIYQYCLGVFPERFFDILYQNEEIFESSSDTNTQFLPNVDFKLLFNADGISETTRQAIWKYLQLILITIMSGIKDKTGFGDTMNLFDGIDENELQTKLTETIDNLTNFFKTMDTQPSSTNTEGESECGGKSEGNDTDSSVPDFSFDGIPDAAGLHEHLKGLFDGKIGKLAKELAEEMSGEFMGMFGDGDKTDIKSTQDVFKKIMKNPKKIMDLLKTVGSKLESKMKDGDISKEEIMKEASELMGKMKGMGNGKEFQEMMKNLTKNMGNLGGMAGAMGKNAKFDMGAMQRMSSQLSQKERMRSKLDKKKSETEGVVLEKKGDNAYSFNLKGEEKQQKSVRPDMRIPELDVSKISETKTVDDWLEEIEPVKTDDKKSKKKKSKGKK